jgi:hypothetical protein
MSAWIEVVPPSDRVDCGPMSAWIEVVPPSDRVDCGPMSAWIEVVQPGVLVRFESVTEPGARP